MTTSLTIPQLTQEMLAFAKFTGKDAREHFLEVACAKTEQEAFEAFQDHETSATGMMRASKRIFTEAILHLHAIRERSLWIFSGQPSWTAYLEHWCENENFSTSSAFKFLALVKIWEGGLGRDVAELPEHADGVYTILPLIDESKNKPPMIAQYNPDSGTIMAIHQEWAGTLPAGDTPQDRVRAWTEAQITENDTIHNIRKKMRDQVSSHKGKAQNGAATDHGRIVVRPMVEFENGNGKKVLRDITWEFWQGGKRVCEGIGIQQLNKNERARELFCQMIGHSWT